jgi:hypothetical protein
MLPMLMLSKFGFRQAGFIGSDGRNKKRKQRPRKKMKRGGNLEVEPELQAPIQMELFGCVFRCFSAD